MKSKFAICCLCRLFDIEKIYAIADFAVPMAMRVLITNCAAIPQCAKRMGVFIA